MRQALLTALEKRYKAKISEADATIKIYLENPVGIGEHPQHLDEIDKQLQIIVDAREKLDKLIQKIANAEENLKVLQEFEDAV